MKRFFLPLCVMCFCFSCAISISNAAFLKRMDEVDALVASGNVKSALKILDTLNKGSYSAQQRLGLYRRYNALGEFSSAEMCLKTGLKDVPDNTELTAVYAWHLLERGRIDEAAPMAQKLSGTRYGSINTEIQLRASVASGESGGTDDRSLVPLFVDAYNVTKNDAWLINAAALYALDGDIASAARLAPGIASSSHQAMFWGCLLLDVDYPREASGYFEAAQRIFSYMDPYETDVSGRALLNFLTADSFIRQGEVERAREMWERQINAKDPLSIPALTFFNLAQSAKAKKDYIAWYDNLVECLKRDDMSLYVLNAYADYAFNQPLAPTDGFEGALRQSGLSSRGMSAFSTIPRVPFEDPASRIKNALLKTHSPEYLTAYIRFLLAVQSAGDESFASGKDASPLANKSEITLARDAWLWDALEEHLDSNNGYPEDLARFAFSYLLSKRKNEDARQVFTLYFTKRYGAPPSGEQTASLLPRLSSWEREAIAWISLAENPVLSLRIYESLYNKEIDEINPYSALKTSYEPPFEVIVNLAEIYIALGKKDRAELLYQEALSLESDAQHKAELLYRLADFQSANGNVRQARLNLDYCLVLDPEHRAARILQKRL